MTKFRRVTAQNPTLTAEISGQRDGFAAVRAEVQQQATNTPTQASGLKFAADKRQEW